MRAFREYGDCFGMALLEDCLIIYMLVVVCVLSLFKKIFDDNDSVDHGECHAIRGTAVQPYQTP